MKNSARFLWLWALLCACAYADVMPAWLAFDDGSGNLSAWFPAQIALSIDNASGQDQLAIMLPESASLDVRGFGSTPFVGDISTYTTIDISGDMPASCGGVRTFEPLGAPATLFVYTSNTEGICPSESLPSDAGPYLELDGVGIISITGNVALAANPVPEPSFALWLVPFSAAMAWRSRRKLRTSTNPL